MRCKACHYDLRGAVERRCPECGLVFDPADAVGDRSPNVSVDVVIGGTFLLLLAAGYIALFFMLFLPADSEMSLQARVIMAATLAFIPTFILGIVLMLIYGVIFVTRRIRPRN